MYHFLLNSPDIELVIAQYRLGTISKGYRFGAITLPYIDINGKIRTIQVKQFDKSNHTVKYGTDFLHSMLEKQCIKDNVAIPSWLNDYIKNEIKVSCLFGEHLLNKFPLNRLDWWKLQNSHLLCIVFWISG
ncbi:MAG: hypothetical protein IPG12_03185 [Saprospiraceae bacterium]|nr:hypothetical protein [Saprospiraceae bacterium]